MRMRLVQADPLASGHPDLPLLQRLANALKLRAAGGNLSHDLPLLIRQAIDEVIDTPRTGRVHARELEKTEKTYIGTKVEIIVRNYFRLPKGILDLLVDGLDVDVKNTLGDSWMIPREAVGKPCIVVASDEERRTCYFGIIIAKLEYLTQATNQDLKRSITAAGMKNIFWLVFNQAYPPSFWSELGDTKTHTIMRGLSGTDRVAALFREALRVVVHRDIVQAVAQQKDYMKRLRKNGGARDRLEAEGIAILSGLYDTPLLQPLGLPALNRDEFISVMPQAPEHIDLLRRAGKIR
ncbi:MAG: NaeI family type II restriction endonuclease [Vitreimonas sp.]